MKACYISHKIIEAVSCYSSCAVKIYTVESFHYLGMIRNFKVGYYRLSVSLYLNVFAVILTYRNRRIDDIGDYHHSFLNFFAQLFFLLLKLFKLIRELLYLSLYLLSLVLFALCHKSADLL